MPSSSCLSFYLYLTRFIFGEAHVLVSSSTLGRLEHLCVPNSLPFASKDFSLCLIVSSYLAFNSTPILQQLFTGETGPFGQWFWFQTWLLPKTLTRAGVVDEWVTNSASAAADYGHISFWDTSAVTSLYDTFTGAAFNDCIAGWDTSAVTDMFRTFASSSFNQDINEWDTSRETTLKNTFNNADNFNGDISAWDTSAVTDMLAVFAYNDGFNRDIGLWGTGKVALMHSAFYKGTAFNQDQQLWVPGEVLNMDNMFNGAIKFYQDISGWNVGKVTKSMECFTAM